MIKTSVAHFRRNLAEMLYRVRYGNKIVVVYCHGKPSAVIIPFDQAEKLQIVQNIQ
jgi:prevent-host-death family protein